MRSRPPISSHSAPVPNTRLVTPQNSTPSGSVSAIVPAASAVIAVSTFALVRPDNRTDAAEAGQMNRNANVSDTPSVRPTEIASMPMIDAAIGRRCDIAT